MVAHKLFRNDTCSHWNSQHARVNKFALLVGVASADVSASLVTLQFPTVRQCQPIKAVCFSQCRVCNEIIWQNQTTKMNYSSLLATACRGVVKYLLHVTRYTGLTCRSTGEFLRKRWFREDSYVSWNFIFVFTFLRANIKTRSVTASSLRFRIYLLSFLFVWVTGTMK